MNMTMMTLIKEHYDELFDGDSDTEEGFKNKLYRVIRKVRKENAKYTGLEQVELETLRRVADMLKDKNTLQEKIDARGEKQEVTQFRLPFDY